MNAGVELLFDDFAASHARGEHPDAREYLERAGESRDELARLLDGFLAAAPVQPASEETVALFESLLPVGARLASPDEPPLLAERVRQGWRRDEIVDWIRERFGIEEEKREKVSRYWHELEIGLLPMGGVSMPLREALGQRFGESAQAALLWKLPPLETDVAVRRVADRPTPPVVRYERVFVPTAEPEPDEVDELFLGGGADPGPSG